MEIEDGAKRGARTARAIGAKRVRKKTFGVHFCRSTLTYPRRAGMIDDPEVQVNVA